MEIRCLHAELVDPRYVRLVLWQVREAYVRGFVLSGLAVTTAL